MTQEIRHLLAHQIVDAILLNLQENYNLAPHVRAELIDIVENVLYDAGTACE